MSDAIITQNQARQLGLLMFACVARLGGNGALVDADDHLTVCGWRALMKNFAWSTRRRTRRRAAIAQSAST